MSDEQQTDVDLLHRCKEEVRALHSFFEDWFRGKVEDTDDVFGRFENALGEHFAMVSPEGVLSKRGALVGGLRPSHGSWGQSEGQIRIERLKGREIGPGLALLTYQEWHDLEGDSKGRVSTVIFREDPGSPGGVSWVHVHETSIQDPS